MLCQTMKANANASKGMFHRILFQINQCGMGHKTLTEVHHSSTVCTSPLLTRFGALFVSFHSKWPPEEPRDSA